MPDASSQYAGVERCHLCSKFMSRADVRAGIIWTPYGGRCDFEPPPPEFAHRRCWAAASEARQREIAGISWIKPMAVGPDD